jgi:hypothetical protein
MADPATLAAVGAIGSIAAPVIGGLIGGSSARRQAREAAALRQQALAQFAGIDLPTIADQLYNLEAPDYAGDLTAIQEQAVAIDPTAMENIAVDPRLAQEQMKALEAISQRADQGLTETDMMAFQQARRGAAAEAQAKQEQVLQSMQQRGIGGAGAELAARLMAAQAGGDRVSQESMQIAQEDSRQRQANLQALANLASGMRTQEFGEQSDVARAKDALAQFRAQNTQAVQARNVGRQQDAATRNVNLRQGIAEQAANMRNQEEMRRANLYGDQFNRQMQLAGAKSNIMTGNAANIEQQAGRTADMWSGIGSGIGSGLASWASKKDAETKKVGSGA